MIGDPSCFLASKVVRLKCKGLAMVEGQHLSVEQAQ